MLSDVFTAVNVQCGVLNTERTASRLAQSVTTTSTLYGTITYIGT
jgi:hypothetical protein